ncbi:MAG: transposase [Spirochaetota bacterium]
MSEIYHVLSRGVDKRKIFLDDQDYFRFIHDLFEFNDEDWVNNTFRRFKQMNDIASRTSVKKERKPRKLLVDIHAFVLMPNHYHILLSPRKEKGISRFMKKLNMGYAKYFNQKYERKGTLFERRYKFIIVKDNSHFIHLPYYIHLNPLDLLSTEWRQREIKNYGKSINFLEKYRWSSHLDYLGKKNFPSVINKKILLDFFEGENEYKKSIYGWLKSLDAEKIEELKVISLEE